MVILTCTPIGGPSLGAAISLGGSSSRRRVLMAFRGVKLSFTEIQFEAGVQ